MDEGELRRLCRATLRELGLRPPLRVGQLCERLGAARSRPIVLESRADLPVSGGFGCLCPFPDKDLIVYQRNSTPPGRDWIIFHELIHLIRGHVEPEGPGGTLMCGALLTERDSAARQGHTLYDDWKEWEAETGAAILAEWSVLPACSPSLDAPQRGVRAFVRALGGSGSWS